MSFGKSSQTTIPELSQEQKDYLKAQTGFFTGTIAPTYTYAVACTGGTILGYVLGNYAANQQFTSDGNCYVTTYTTTNPTPWTTANAGQNLRILLKGVLTFNIFVLIQQIPGFWIFDNHTAGNFSITVGTTAGSYNCVVDLVKYDSTSTPQAAQTVAYSIAFGWITVP